MQLVELNLETGRTHEAARAQGGGGFDRAKINIDSVW